MLHCWASHSLFPGHVFISYVYASCFMLVIKDLWDAFVAFPDSHDRL